MHGGHLAFTLLRKLSIGDMMKASDVRLPDGATPAIDSLLACGTCGLPFDWNRAIREAQDETD